MKCDFCRKSTLMILNSRDSIGLLGLSFILLLSLESANATYLCPPGSPGWPCLRDSLGNPVKIRALFMDKPYVTSNPAAVQKAAKLGISYSCDSALALPECFVAANWNGGWIGAFMSQIFEDMGVEVIAMTRANTSSAARKAYTGTSSFTRCVWEVLLGNVDVCVGDFWETNERRNLTAFTNAIDSDTFSLFTRLVPSTATNFNVSNVFMPFDSAVWLLLGMMVIFVSFALWIVEAPYNVDPDVGFGPNQGPPNLFGLYKSAYYAMMSFFGGGLPASRWPSKIVVMGFMFFVFLHVTSYVASLASTLVTTNQQLGEVSSLQDIITQGKRLCLYQSMAQATSQILGSAVQSVQMDNYGPMLEKLASGNCSGAVVGKFESLTFIRASNVNFTVCDSPSDPNNFATCATASVPPTNYRLNPSTCGADCGHAQRFCTLVDTQDPTISLITLAWQLPVRRDLEPWLSAAMLRQHMRGLVAQTQAEQLLDLNPVICPAPSLPSGALTVQQLSGAYVVGGVLMLTGLAAHIVLRVVRAVSGGGGARVGTAGGGKGDGGVTGVADGAGGEALGEESIGPEESVEDRCLATTGQVTDLIHRVRRLAAAAGGGAAAAAAPGTNAAALRDSPSLKIE